MENEDKKVSAAVFEQKVYKTAGKPYEAPRVEELGSLEALTQNNVGLSVH